MYLQSGSRFIPQMENLIADCRASVAQRASQARALRTWRYTGSPDGNTSILNRLNHHIERTAPMLFSPSELRFSIDFENSYGKKILDQAEVGGRVLTRRFRQRDIDIQFAESVDLALTYGSCVSKLVNSHGGMNCRLVMPWQIGVYREDRNDLADQEAIVETNHITPFDLWRRVSHLPNAAQLYRRACSYSKKGGDHDTDATYFHQILLAGTSPVVQTAAPYAQQAGGMVNVSADLGGAMVSADVAESLIPVHEIWVLNDETGDYTTIQIAEPDILITSPFRHRNFFVPDYHPYVLTQPNRVAGNIWGRSEIADLMKLQHLLRDRLEDLKRLMGMQYDRLLAFIGQGGPTDETYDMFRQAGWMNLDSGSDVKDLTPKLPDAAFADIKEINDFMDEVSGFGGILSGQGEPGVRAGNHAATLLKTASPRMRDRALMVERQCADLGDKAFNLMSAKEAKAYWVGDPGQEGNEFLLSQLPEDYEIHVDSHSSSPIYEEDHKDIAGFLAKLGVGAKDIVKMLPGVPQKDLVIQHLNEQEAAKAKMIQEHPELLTKGAGAKKH